MHEICHELPYEYGIWEVKEKKQLKQRINAGKSRLKTDIRSLSFLVSQHAFFSETLYCLMKNGRVCGQAITLLTLFTAALLKLGLHNDGNAGKLF